MALIDEIQEKSKEISVDAYSMSIGELISMYKDGDLDIHPEFQRFFRWSSSQKTRLIESLLLNIPIPPIFVSQNENGVWEIVDGLQRVSTILQFVGCYKDECGSTQKPLVLEATDFLPSLKDKTFSETDIENTTSFETAEQRYLKRAKISIIILKKESDQSGKYELFQRLNTGGTSLSEQEVRNCIMVMENREYYNKLQELAEFEPFKSTLRLNYKVLRERYDMELLSRFICLRAAAPDSLKIKDFSYYLDKRIVKLFNSPNWNLDNEIAIFKKTFTKINDALGDDAFCKYSTDSNRFKGSTITPAFELIAIGLGRRNGELPQGFDLRESLIQFWKELKGEIPWKGKTAKDRIPQMINLAVNFYGEN